MSSEPDKSRYNILEVKLNAQSNPIGILILIITSSVLITLWPISCADSTSYPPSADPQSQEITDIEPKLLSPVSPTWGFTLFLTGNWDGQLGPCGCSERQLGGIDRRTHILNSAPASGRLLLDAGPLINSEGRQAQLKLETFLLSLQHLQYDAIALTGPEMILLQENLPLGPDDRPPIIATNMPPEVRLEFAAVAYLEKNLRRGGENLDCLILALPDPQSMVGRWSSQKLQLQDPVSSVIEILTALNIDPHQSHNDKFVIVMLPDDNEFLVQQIKQIPALDLLVRAGYGDMPELIENSDNTPPVVTTGKLGKYVTKIELPISSSADVKKAQFEPIPIEEDFPQDPKIIEFFNNYQTSLKIENLIDSPYLPRQALDDDNTFTGSLACADCHADVYLIWNNFGHAHAMETLINENRQYDPECVKCHTIAMEYEIGYRSMEKTPHLADVGCEMCHGPGLKHRINTYTMYQEQFFTCEKCHTHENSPNFEGQREEYFQKIRHWQEPRIYWK